MDDLLSLGASRTHGTLMKVRSATARSIDVGRTPASTTERVVTGNATQQQVSGMYNTTASSCGMASDLYCLLPRVLPITELDWYYNLSLSTSVKWRPLVQACLLDASHSFSHLPPQVRRSDSLSHDEAAPQ